MGDREYAALLERIKGRRARKARLTSALAAATVAVVGAPLSDAEYREWAATIADRLGLQFPPSRAHFLRERLWARARANGLASLNHYHTFLAGRPREWDELADALTVNESRFYRHEGTFDALRERVLPELVRRREAAGRDGAADWRRLSLWSAGCSTGEEAYTLAMTALETVPLPRIWKLEVLGTDLSPRNVARARAGVYSARRLEALPPAWRERYAAPDAGGPPGAAGLKPARDPAGGSTYRMGELVRGITTFRAHNLCDARWGVPPQDVIVCQNVLLYFGQQERVRVLDRFYETLRPGGYLLVGAAELPTAPVRQGLRPSRLGDALAYRK